MIVGIFFLLFGLSILLRVLFGWHIPIFRTFFALFLIYIGVRMLVGKDWGWNSGWRVRNSESVVFDSGKFHFDQRSRNHFSTVFGSSTVDLRNVPKAEGEAKVHIDTVFGDTKILVSPDQALRIRASAVFGEARMPNGDMVAFGTLNYKTPETEPAFKLRIHADAVFGSVRFITTTGSSGTAGNSQGLTGDDDDDE